MHSGKHKEVVMFLAHDFIYPYVDPRPYKEAISLIKNGYDVCIICLGNSKQALPKCEKYDDIKVYRVFQNMPSYTTPVLWRLQFHLMYILKSIVLARKLKPDMIHSHDLDTLAAGVGLKLLISRPLIYDAHENYPSMYESRSEFLHVSKFKRISVVFIRQLMRLYEKILIKFADSVIAAEALYAPTMEKHYKITPSVILNLPVLDSFDTVVDTSFVIKQYKLDGKIVISQVGGIGETRGIFTILKALQFIPDNNLRFFIIGRATTDLIREINEYIEQNQLKDKVIFLSKGVRYEDTPQFYKVSDITMALLYSLPTYVTSVPTKLYESLAAGVPVIAADMPHITAIVEHYKVGLCADSHDPMDVAAKLNLLINDEKMRREMGQNCLKVTRERFNWALSEKKLLEIYDSFSV
ncbi:glycosyltransferase family 4 protein [Chloroflexota bacterium]